MKEWKHERKEEREDKRMKRLKVQKKTSMRGKKNDRPKAFKYRRTEECRLKAQLDGRINT